MTPAAPLSPTASAVSPAASPAAFDLRHHDGVLIDLDGTLVDTLGDFVAALNLMLHDLALPGAPQLQAADVEAMVGKGSEHLVQSALMRVAKPSVWASPSAQAQGAAADAAAPKHPLFAQALAAYLGHYRAVNGQHATVYPGVVRALECLRRAGLKLACVTNKPLAFARQLLELKQLDGYFDAVFGGDSFAHKKPHPLPLIKACEALGIATQRALMLGDSSNDAQAARAAGCTAVLVTYGYNHGQPVRRIDADWFIDAMHEVENWR